MTNSLTVVAKVFSSTLILFAVKNVNSSCNAKATHIFFSKKVINKFAIFQDRNFNVTLTNMLSFEQLTPDHFLGKRELFALLLV